MDRLCIPATVPAFLPALLSLFLLALAPPTFAAGTITVLHAFDGLDGHTPVGRLLEGSDGNFYGVTRKGGADDCGTIFRITSAGDLTELHSFIGALHGCEAESGLVLGPETDETFYGVAAAGGSSNVGTAYRITPDGDFETVHHFVFPGDTPRAPMGRLLLGEDGHFYGTSNGPLPGGKIFRLTTEGDVTVIHSFEGGAGGASPRIGLTADLDGNFYGTTLFGGPGGASTSNGVIYRISPDGDDFKVLHDFTGTGGESHAFDGPLALGPDGNLYGTTAQGGSGAVGVAYRITPDGEFTSFDFTGFDGSFIVGAPGGGLTLADDGNFYGSATTFFRMTPAGVIIRLTNELLPGGAVAGALVQGSDGGFYGVSREGPGSVFRVTATGGGNGSGGSGGSGGGGGSGALPAWLVAALAGLFIIRSRGMNRR